MVAHREQVEQHLEAPLVEVLEAPEALLVEVLEGQRELEVLQAQVGLPALELLPRVPLEQSLEQFLRRGRDRWSGRCWGGWSCGSSSRGGQ